MNDSQCSPISGQPLQLSEEEAKDFPNTPDTLKKALNALERDSAFLMEGGVFGEELIQAWIDYKRDKEIRELELRPHPHEFHLYYDC